MSAQKLQVIVSGFTVTVAVAGLAFASVVHAQPAEQACAPDIQAYCAGVPQGEGRIAKCLREHTPQLSPACQRGMAQTATLMKEVVMACEDDLHQFCAGAAPGTAKECLRANFRQLSPRCKRELFAVKKAM